MHKIFSYVVAKDTGVAPNVDGAVCTVCLCKPGIRRNAVVGDWIVGLWPVRLGRFRVTYVMRVGQKLTMQDYYECGEFDQKKPDRSSTPDNIYEPHPLLGPRRRRDTPTWLHPTPKQTSRDLSGMYALIADRFCYFGSTICELPRRFRKLDFPDPSARRYVMKKHLRDAESRNLIEWLDGHGQGVLGTPRDALSKVVLPGAKHRPCTAAETPPRCSEVPGLMAANHRHRAAERRR